MNQCVRLLNATMCAIVRSIAWVRWDQKSARINFNGLNCCPITAHGLDGLAWPWHNSHRENEIATAQFAIILHLVSCHFEAKDRRSSVCRVLYLTSESAIVSRQGRAGGCDGKYR